MPAANACPSSRSSELLEPCDGTSQATALLARAGTTRTRKIKSDCQRTSRCFVKTLAEALARGTPEIFNTDQGVQYTANAFTDRLALTSGGRLGRGGRSASCRPCCGG
jgi:hypothetical protein